MPERAPTYGQRPNPAAYSEDKLPRKRKSKPASKPIRKAARRGR